MAMHPNNTICLDKIRSHDSQTLYNNLMMIDSSLPLIIGECMRFYYSGRAHTFVEAERLLYAENPLDFDLKDQPLFYERKLKQFLLAVCLGVTADSLWNGKFDDDCGFIVVEDGSKKIYNHIYNKAELEEYLFRNACL